MGWQETLAELVAKDHELYGSSQWDGLIERGIVEVPGGGAPASLGTPEALAAGGFDPSGELLHPNTSPAAPPVVRPPTIFPSLFPALPRTPAGAAPSGGMPSSAAAPDMNLPFGYQYVEPMLRFLLGMYGLQEQQQSGAAQRGLTERMFNAEGLRNAGADLARLDASGPASAAELAFRRAGLGYSPFGANRIDTRQLLTSGTRGAGGTSDIRIGAQPEQSLSSNAGLPVASIGREFLGGGTGTGPQRGTIKTTLTDEQLIARGITPTSRIGDIVTISTPADIFGTLASIPGITQVERAQQMQLSGTGGTGGGGAAGTSSVGIGGDTVTTPNSWNFEQLRNFARDPLGGGVVASLSKAATGMDPIASALAMMQKGIGGFGGLQPAF